MPLTKGMGHAKSFSVITVIVLLMSFICMGNSSILSTDSNQFGVCIRNCAQCKKMFGAYFEGQLCADACVKFKGKIIPDCEDLDSISPFLNKEQIDWSKVAKSGVKHIFIKMTEGKTFVDPNFTKNWEGAKNAGINVNCYHYFRADSSPEQQMANIKKYLTAVKFDPAKNILAIDVEEKNNEKATAEEMAKNLNALLSLITKDNITTMIYTSYGYWNTRVKWEKYSFGKYPLWVAHYTTKPTPTLPKPWTAWAWWQYSATGKVDGIKGNVDMDWVRL